MLKEYKTVSEIAGPLMMVEGVDQAKYGEIVDIEMGNGTIRHGQILHQGYQQEDPAPVHVGKLSKHQCRKSSGKSGQRDRPRK